MWFYAVNNEQRGPVEDAELAELVARDIVRGETLVWREGMADWQRYDAIMSRPAARPVPAVGLSPVEEASPSGDLGIGGRQCRECGGYFAPENMLQFQGQWICAKCKPLYFERLREGAPVAGQYRYAGFWIRFCAKFVDGLIMLLFYIPVMFVFATVVAASAETSSEPPGLGLSLLMMLIQYVIPICYTVFFLGRFSATPGKMACGLRVIRSTGERVTYLRALGRYFAELLSGITLSIGYIMAAFDSEQHRALHDYMCDTRVVYK